MRILIDANVLIDFIAMRQPYYPSARRIVDACDRNLLSGCIAAHSVPNIYYILRKKMSDADRREILKSLCGIFTIEGIDKYKLIASLDDEDFKDIEDSLQAQCAAAFRADYIITRNEADFANSKIPCVEPDTFCRRFLNEAE